MFAFFFHMHHSRGVRAFLAGASSTWQNSCAVPGPPEMPEKRWLYQQVAQLQL
jgi:hypothetical protein